MNREERKAIDAKAAEEWEKSRVQRLRALARVETIFERFKKDPRWPILHMKISSVDNGIEFSGLHRAKNVRMKFVLSMDVCLKEEIQGVVDAFNNAALAFFGRKQGEHRKPDGGGAAGGGGGAPGEAGPEAGPSPKD